jgi:ubiquitin-like protein Pup
MATRDIGGQAQSERGRTEQDDTTAPEADAEATARAEELSAKTDDVLDDIDKVLEENAEEFVRGYVQKGGQ